MRVIFEAEAELKPKASVPTVSRDVFYCSIPYISEFKNQKIVSELNLIFRKYYPQLNLRLIFKNNFTIQNFFKFKDVIPENVRSNLVYEFQCRTCKSYYIGETTRHFHTRISEHLGISPRTGAPLSKTNSSIFQHKLETGHSIDKTDFKIIHSGNSLDLRTFESIFIRDRQPCLSEQYSSEPLYILN